MNKKYAGIGSRETPDDVLVMIWQMAASLAERNYLLRSGGAKGADKAFEKGCDARDGQKEIFRPQDSTKIAELIASSLHPAWDRCNEYVRKLHGRNTQIILGKELNDPVDFVICWTYKGNTQGGTAMGIKLAGKHNIPVLNLGEFFYDN